MVFQFLPGKMQMIVKIPIRRRLFFLFQEKKKRNSVLSFPPKKETEEKRDTDLQLKFHQDFRKVCIRNITQLLIIHVLKK